MKVELKKITVGDVYDGYINDGEKEMGVVGYGDNLNIRPKYQRNYVYKDKQRDEVVRTILKGFPLNIFYWVDRGEEFDDSDEPRYEVLDGQQRTISICDYIDGVFSVDGHYFHSLPIDKKNAILQYELFVYFCTGTDSEKLDWFSIVNIAGERLTNQELRNAVYSGSWVSDAKRYFSKTNGPAYKIAGDYMKGEANRQEYMETAIEWHKEITGDATIEDYMSKRKDWSDAKELWQYFRNVVDWLESIFIKKRSQMKGLPWGLFYNEFKDVSFNPQEVEERISELMSDKEITSKKGIYEYILTGNESALSLRLFDEDIRQGKYEEQKGICMICGKHFDIKEMQADHIIPWSKGGKTTFDNCRMLCAECNIKMSNKHSAN